MSIGRFSISNMSQEFTIHTQDINGQGNIGSPYLNIPLYISFVPYRNANNRPYSQFDLLHLYAELSMTSENFKVGQVSTPLNFPIHGPNSFLTSLRFQLSQEVLCVIEKYRNGNLPASLLFNLQVAHYDVLNLAKGGSSVEQPLIRNPPVN